MDDVTREQLRRFVITPLAGTGISETALDRATDAVLEHAPIESWNFDHWYATDAISFAELQRIVTEAIGS